MLPPFWLLMAALVLIGVGLIKVVLALIEVVSINVRKSASASAPAPAAQKTKKHKDASLAGQTLYYVILVLGLATVLHGMALLGATPDFVRHAFSKPATHIAINVVLGLFCIVFYSIVLNSDRIPKEKDAALSYFLFGIGGGLAFLATVPLVMLVPVVLKRQSLLTPMNALSMTAFAMTSAATVMVVVMSLMAEKDELKSDYGRFVDVLTMVAANVATIF